MRESLVPYSWDGVHWTDDPHQQVLMRLNVVFYLIPSSALLFMAANWEGRMLGAAIAAMSLLSLMRVEYVIAQIRSSADRLPLGGRKWNVELRVIKGLRLLSYFLPRQLRQRAFEPAFSDLCLDHAERRRFRGKWARRALMAAMLFKGLLIILGCVRCLVVEHLAWLLPDELRRWWGRGG